LRRLRDFATVLGDGTIDQRIVQEGLTRLAIDPNGLEKQDRNILSTIINFYGGGPVGASTLCISVGEAIESLEDFYEPYLIQQGYLIRTPRGRCVTSKAYQLLGLAVPENVNEYYTTIT
jgi:Holliday junction DNA helicase RuvB